jgi:hypothetical protein
LLYSSLEIRNGDDPGTKLPLIIWNDIRDYCNNQMSGYSFLSDQRNKFLIGNKDFLSNKMKESSELFNEWYNASDSTFHDNAIVMYEDTLNKFRELLLGLIHLTGGQPGRGTEVTNIKYCNTQQSVRNVYIRNGLVYIMPAYHKGMIQTNQEKTICRYLPVPVGESLVYYIWLVLPFWQRVVGHHRNCSEYSPFLFANQMVY